MHDARCSNISGTHAELWLCFRCAKTHKCKHFRVSPALVCTVHHTAESSDPNLSKSSAVCITPWSQTAHRVVKIEILVSLWLLSKGQSGEILLRVNRSIMKENNCRKKFRFGNPKICEIETEFENTLACLSGAWVGSNHEKNRGKKSCDTLPLKFKSSHPIQAIYCQGSYMSHMTGL